MTATTRFESDFNTRVQAFFVNTVKASFQYVNREDLTFEGCQLILAPPVDKIRINNILRPDRPKSQPPTLASVISNQFIGTDPEHLVTQAVNEIMDLLKERVPHPPPQSGWTLHAYCLNRPRVFISPPNPTLRVWAHVDLIVYAECDPDQNPLILAYEPAP